MSERGFRVYPSGIALQDPMLSHTQLMGGDLEVNDLFDKYLKGTHHIGDSDYFMGVVKKALDLLGTDSNWLATQIFNPNLNRYRIDFLVDTVIYISTGRRDQTLTTWRALCCDQTLTDAKGISLQGYAINKKLVLPKDMIFSQPSSIISAWLAHNGGFADLVESLYLMFGDATRA